MTRETRSGDRGTTFHGQDLVHHGQLPRVRTGDGQGGTPQGTPGGRDRTTAGATRRPRAWEASLAEWPGDPAKAARIITDVVELEEPPLRLLLGAGAVESTAKATKERAAETQEWAPVSRFVDFGTDETPDVHALLGAR